MNKKVTRRSSRMMSSKFFITSLTLRSLRLESLDFIKSMSKKRSRTRPEILMFTKNMLKREDILKTTSIT